MKRSGIWLLIAITALWAAGCSSSTQDDQVSETQRQLEEAQQQLQELQEQVEAGELDVAKQQLAETQAQVQALQETLQKAEAERKRSAAENSEQKKEMEELAADASAGVTEAKTQAGEAIDRADQAEVSAGEAREMAAEAQRAAEEAKEAAAPPPTYTIEKGTEISVRTTNTISTKTAAAGSLFQATLESPIVVSGVELASEGDSVEGIVVDSRKGGRAKGVASLTVALRAITPRGASRIDLETNSISLEAGKSTKKDAVKVGVASGIGAAIGAIAGGGKGAAIGAGVGAGAGTGAVLLTRGEAAELPAESPLVFRLSSSVTVQAKK